jgi:hypothetical protein
LQDQSKSISSSDIGQAHQTQRIATGVINAEHSISNVNARLEALNLRITSETQIETKTRTTLSFRLMPLSITFEQTTSHKQRTLVKPKRAVRLLTVRLPKWFLHRQYDLQLLHATSGWPFTMNACSVVPYDSPFFNACRTGEIETIKALLSSQQASIYDRTPDRASAFQLAIGHRQLEVCELLRHAGIFAQFDDNDYRDALCALEESLNDFTEHNVSLLRVAAPPDNPDWDWFEEYSQTRIDNGITIIHFDIDLLFLLNSAQSDTAMLNVSHLKEYFELPNGLRYGSRTFMPYIVRVLSNTSVVCEILEAPDRYVWVVYALAKESALALLRGNWHPDQLDCDQWSHAVQPALRAIVDAGLSPHQTSEKLESTYFTDHWYQGLNMTPLGLLCIEATWIRVECGHEAHSQWKKDVRITLQAWLSGLHSAGIDLLQYAKAESACYGGASDSLAILLKNGGIITVVTGSRPKDWHLSLWEPREPHARLFWCLIEGIPVVSRLTARIMESFSLSEGEDLTSPDLPGSWPAAEACFTEEMESWLLQRTDDDLAEIEQDLSLRSEADFLAKWDSIDRIVGFSIGSSRVDAVTRRE